MDVGDPEREIQVEPVEDPVPRELPDQDERPTPEREPERTAT